MNRLYILTPCIRPENLSKLEASIPDGAIWCIIYEEGVEHTSTPRANYILQNPTQNRVIGKHEDCTVRNYGFDNLPLQDGDWIYFLDDDNLMHPNFPEVFKLIDDAYAMIVFGQEYRGKKRFHPVGIHKCRVDCGAILANWKYAKDIRWCNDYCGDFYYIEALGKLGPVKIVETIGCYYNKLREV